MPSSSSQNVSVYAPQIILQQNPTRTTVVFNPSTLSGITLYSGITTGDAVRYDPLISGYTLCDGKTEVGSQVLGIVESMSTNLWTIVTSGSVVYPSNRLAGITYGGDGGVDVLYLDEKKPGGLTGTVVVTPTSGEKIVKPVIQIAPHGIYTGIVTNTLGYKSGYKPSTIEEGVVLGTGAIIFCSNTISPGPNWLNISSELTVDSSVYPDLYSIYLNKTDFIETVKLNQGSVITEYIGDTAYQLQGATKINVGTIVGCNTDPLQNSIDIRKTINTTQMNADLPVYIDIDQNVFSVVSTTISKVIIPPVTNIASQAGISLSPFIKAYESIKTFIPSTLQCDDLIVTNDAKIGTYQNIKLTLDDIYNKINIIKDKIGGIVF